MTLKWWQIGLVVGVMAVTDVKAQTENPASGANAGETEQAETGTVASDTERAALKIDVDCTSEDAVLAAMDGRPMKEMTAIHEFCTAELVRFGENLGPQATGEDVYNTALNQLDLEITTLKVFQADLLNGGRVDTYLRRLGTEIEALEKEIEEQKESDPKAAEKNSKRLEGMKADQRDLLKTVEELKRRIDDDLADLRDDAPSIAITIRMDIVEEGIARAYTYVATTEGVMEEMGTLYTRLDEGQETN
jgi:hypothetical protein